MQEYVDNYVKKVDELISKGMPVKKAFDQVSNSFSIEELEKMTEYTINKISDIQVIKK